MFEIDPPKSPDVLERFRAFQPHRVTAKDKLEIVNGPERLCDIPVPKMVLEAV